MVRGQITKMQRARIRLGLVLFLRSLQKLAVYRLSGRGYSLVLCYISLLWRLGLALYTALDLLTWAGAPRCEASIRFDNTAVDQGRFIAFDKRSGGLDRCIMGFGESSWFTIWLYCLACRLDGLVVGFPQSFDHCIDLELRVTEACRGIVISN